MRNARVWAGLLGIEHAVLERLEYDEAAQLHTLFRAFWPRAREARVPRQK